MEGNGMNIISKRVRAAAFGHPYHCGLCVWVCHYPYTRSRVQYTIFLISSRWVIIEQSHGLCCTYSYTDVPVLSADGLVTRKQTAGAALYIPICRVRKREKIIIRNETLNTIKYNTLLQWCKTCTRDDIV